MKNILIIIFLTILLVGAVFTLRNSFTDNIETSPTPSIQKDTLHSICDTANDCQSGQICLNYFGIAGPNGPLFKTCEIPCPNGNSQCPKDFKCVTIADGPGTVCQKINVE